MVATMSVMGLYQYDNTIFDGLRLPFLSPVNRQLFINTLLAECAELEVLYPQPELMKTLIAGWTEQRYLSWLRLYNTTTQQYNPLENYDRKEEWTDSTSESGSGTGISNSSASGSNQAAAFNEGALKTISGDETQSNGNSGSTMNRSQEIKRSGHAHGNIGITTPNQMLTGERKLYAWDFYQTVISEFKQRFLILVY